MLTGLSGNRDGKCLWHRSLSEIEQLGLYPRLHTVESGATSPHPVIDGRSFLSFAGNNYLGLAEDPQVIAAACRAIQEYGIGPGFSRAIGGTPRIVAELERELAAWTGFEACLALPTGYMANVGVLRALLRPIISAAIGSEPVVFVDQYMHGSVIDGCAVAQVKVVSFRHNDLDDLRRRMARYAEAPKLIVIEGVYTLEGTIVDLPAYVDLAREAGAFLMVDDAHGIGLLGPNGGGTATLFGAIDGVDLYMGCMDKALGGTGGFLCGSHDLIRLLVVGCRSSVLSSCFPVGTAGGMIEAIKIAKESPERRERALFLAARLREKLRAVGLKVLGDSRHPSVCVMIGPDCHGLEIERALYSRAIHQPVVRFPAVPKDKCRLRLNVSGQHSQADIDLLSSALTEIIK